MNWLHRTFGSIREFLRPWYLRYFYFRAFPSRKPPYFEDCWQFPHTTIDQCGQLLDPPAPFSRDFLILPMTDWHTRIQRSQFLAQTLAALGHRCFLLNPHLGREFRGSASGPPLLARISPNVYELHVRLPREPVYHHRNLSESESQILAGAVTELVASGHVSNLTQIVSFPLWLRLALTVKERFPGALVYDCHDQLNGFEGVAPEIVALEQELVASSDLVICSADSLREHCLGSGATVDRCHVVKNAVSETLGQPVFGVALHTASQPVIGYLGALESWFDASAIRAAAIARPNWRFVLVGRIESRNVRLLADLPNVEFMGEIGRERVPEVLARFDVATIPFLLNPLTVAADPIKLYEYLSAGLPVVSSRLPETERFARFIHYYDAPADFVHAVEAALLDGDESLRRQRRQAVKNETWEVRCRLLLDLTESLALTPAVQSSLRA